MDLSRPSTPKNQSSVPPTPQTGTWIHPRFDEIVRRQNARTFTDRNLHQILYSVGGIFTIWLVGKFTRLPTIFYAIDSLDPYSTWVFWIVRVMLLTNIIMGLLPLVRGKDDFSDIPLTPMQRKLLGLAPSSTPASESAQYVTPPRYPRSATPLSATPNSNSPASGRASPIQGTPSKGSPFSPNASPLLHKAIGGMAERRSSYGSPSPLGPGASISSVIPSTPSPSGVGNKSTGLNNKWLYEKGRRSSATTRLFS